MLRKMALIAIGIVMALVGTILDATAPAIGSANLVHAPVSSTAQTMAVRKVSSPKPKPLRPIRNPRQREVQAAAARGETIDCTVWKCISLTFDDGPGDQTPLLLSYLRSGDAPASFFFAGTFTVKNPAYVRAINETPGMLIGNHTFSHEDLTTKTATEMKTDLDKERDLLAAQGVKSIMWMRPPMGFNNAALKSVCRQNGLGLALWDVNPADWKDGNPARIAEFVTTRAKPGSIVLLHDVYPTTVEAVPAIIEQLQSEGFVFVNLNQLVGGSPEPGVLRINRSRTSR